MPVMVTMRSPYAGGVVTVSVSAVARLTAAGWVVEAPPTPTQVATAEDVTDPEQVEAPLPIVEDPGVDLEQPKGNATRAAWRDYAQSLGIDVEGLNRAQIREAVANHTIK